MNTEKWFVWRKTHPSSTRSESHGKQKRWKGHYNASGKKHTGIWTKLRVHETGTGFRGLCVLQASSPTGGSGHYTGYRPRTHTIASIPAYILSPLLSQYYCLHIVNLFVIPIYYDAIPDLMSSSFHSILSVSSVVAQFIALHYTYVYKPLLILVICFTYLVSISHPVLFHITWVYSLPE